MLDSSLSKLDSIRIKIRRLTKSPSESQLSNTDIDSYINTFILYDMPSSVTLGSLKSILRFYTQPYVDSYSTNTSDGNNPLYNFKNEYTLASNTVYISGNLSYFTDSHADFYNKYPRSIKSRNINSGDNITTNFSGTLDSYPVLPRNVIFASIDLNDNYLRIYDDGNGSLTGDGNGTLNYITGEYDLNFSSAPKQGSDIYVQSSTYKASAPRSVLYYNDTFVLSPIPDKCYSIEVEVYRRPTELINNTDMPSLSQWWEYIAYGAASKVLIDRSDFDTSDRLKQEMESKREEVLYKTIIQNTIKEGYGV